MSMECEAEMAVPGSAKTAHFVASFQKYATWMHVQLCVRMQSALASMSVPVRVCRCMYAGACARTTVRVGTCVCLDLQ